MMQEYENERKLVADAMCQPAAVAFLDTVCVPSPKYSAGIVTSIYYEHPSLRFYTEKANGDLLKRKVRVRWYDQATPPDSVWIEVKLRLGSARDKYRMMTRADMTLLSSADMNNPELQTFLYRSVQNWENADLIPKGLIPLICIRYIRRRWICPLTGSRVSLDWDISASRINSHILPHVTSPRLNLAVCEIKNSFGALPSWLETLNRIGFKYQSFSKYGECIELATTGVN